MKEKEREEMQREGKTGRDGKETPCLLNCLWNSSESCSVQCTINLWEGGKGVGGCMAVYRQLFRPEVLLSGYPLASACETPCDAHSMKCHTTGKSVMIADPCHKL